MSPSLCDGDHLLISDQMPLLGQIAIYESPHGVRAHRVITITKTGLLARADAPDSETETVHTSDIIGTVIGRRRPLIRTIALAVKLVLSVRSKRLKLRIR